jgi:seryl-tRNA synthetase
LFSPKSRADPVEPAKKGKKKIQGIPEALQAQWEADRQKKASKKEQRELERLIAEIEGVKPSRKKGKGNSKAQQAALAHLIPASASQVADMFDIDSDDERTQQIRGVGKMRKMMNLPAAPGTGGIGEMEDLVERVREFIRDSGRTTMSMAPMEKEGRQRLHLLADCFGLNSNSKGAGRARFT